MTPTRKVRDEIKEDIAEAEDFAAESPDRIPIRDQMGLGHIHGAVVPGQAPVAFTDPLNQSLQRNLNDGVIEMYARVPSDDEDGTVQGKIMSIEPKETSYLESLEDILQPMFTIDTTNHDDIDDL